MQAIFLRAALAVILMGFQGFAQTPASTNRTNTVTSTRRTNDPNDVIERIKEEGLKRSQVMATMSHLTDVIGPRLTASPAQRQASEWTRTKLASWGLTNAHLEPWGPFGRGWTLRRFSAQVIEPQSIPLIAFPKAWSPSLGDKPLVSEVVHVDIKKPEDFAQYRGKLRGKIVLDGGVQNLTVSFEPLGKRRTETNLLALANAGDGFVSRAPSTNLVSTPEQRATTALLPRKYQFFAEEGVAVLLQASRAGDGGTLFTQGATVYAPRTNKVDDATQKSTSTSTNASRNISPWLTNCPPITPQVTVAAEHYNRLVRMVQQGQSLKVALELQADFNADNLMVDNTLAEIPGTDLADEVVMVGAHLDSWHSGTGATDNAAGSAVVMEAVRILKALDLKPRRTIRVALWTGEEQGLFGSKAYVSNHFGTVVTNRVATNAVASVNKKPEHQKLSVYFNLDNGGGKIRGIYLQNNEAARAVFRPWLVPFRELGAETISYANTAATDHIPFDAVGLPAFQFIQDEIEYMTRTHHSNMDMYDRVIAAALQQASVIIAAFAYQAAMRDEKIPRKPETAPLAPRSTTSRKSSASTAQ